MKRNLIILNAAIPLLAALAFPIQLAAQQPRYKLIDLGTFGGPSSYLATSNGVTSPGAVNQVLNNQGTVVGWGDTPTLDPFAPNCFNPFGQDCFLPLAFQWQKGVLTDLGVLPGGDASTTTWISDTGLIVGQARNGLVDPLIPGFAEIRAVLWKDGKAIDLGTLDGNESSAFSVNSRGQVVGLATNTIPDPFSFLATQLRAFLWQDGAMQDLGTLGGPEAWALFVNERGQVAGFSLTNSTVNPITMSPTQDPFLWEQGTMLDIGTLGGTFGSPYALDNRGQVVGTSNLAGDLTEHPFRWDGRSLLDLGTLGGSFGIAEGINDAGEVVGGATNENDQALLAFLWKDGVMTNLGTLNGDDCSYAFHINSKRQIVGISFPCASGPDGPNVHGFLWQNGLMTDLNAFAPPGSGLTLSFAGLINDRGEIAGVGLLPDGNTHAVLLVPCGEGDEGCDYGLVEGSSTATGAIPAATGANETVAKPAPTPVEIRQIIRSFGPRSSPWFGGFAARPRK
jgi:probable HAF family extracellular repeat protein